MSVRKLVGPMFLLSFVTVAACEDKNASTEAAAAAPVVPAAEAKAPGEAAAAKPAEAVAVVPVKEVALPTPQEVCSSLVEAAKGKDEAKLLLLSTPATQTALASEGAKEHLLTTLAAATCGSAKVEGDSAIIALAGTTPAQEATFSKAADGWKFDGAAFLAKYPIKVAKEKVKKAAAKVQHKLHGHDKKHH